MLWGLYNTYAISPIGPGLADQVVSAQSHFGVLGILAVVLGMAIQKYNISERREQIITYSYVTGQWLLPATLVAISLGMTLLAPLSYL
jgi:hypothetical protein